MKTKNIINTMAVATAILLGFQARASENVISERSENYKCEVETTDEKKYLLDIGWSVVTEKNENTIEKKKISFVLTDLESNQSKKGEMFASSYNGSQLFGSIEIEQSLNSLTLNGFDHRCLRPGCYTKAFNAGFLFYRLTTLTEFEYQVSGDGYFVNEDHIKLDIAQSKCEQVVKYEE